MAEIAAALGRRLTRDFYARPALELAPDLLNKVLLVGPRGADGPAGGDRSARAGRIVEVEAYCGTSDPGSHAFRGPTPRTEIMFGPAGHLYVYFSYGMHWCANVVAEDDGVAGAVLLRALTPVVGVEAMRVDRAAAKRDRDLCNGPAKLTQALAIDGDDGGADLVDADRGIEIVDDGTSPPAEPGVSTRIGLSKGADLPWRWFVEGVADVSR